MLDPIQIKSVHLRQGLETLCIGGTTATDNGGFFVPSRQFLIGRGGVRTIQKRFTVKTHAPYLCAVSNTPIPLERNHLRNSIGGSL